VRTSVDALGAAWIGNLLAYTGLLRTVSSLVYGVERGSHLILESNKAFNRTIYHLHQELEFTVPFEDTFEVSRGFIRLHEEMYHLELPYAIFEVRFTPKQERTLIGAGRDGRSAYMSATHRIPRVDGGGVEEDDFKRYPLKGDSLSAYSKVVDRRFFLGLGSAYIAPDEAAVLMGKRLVIAPSRTGDRHKRPRRRKEVVARLPFLGTPRPRRGRRALEPFFYPLLPEVFDWDTPPFFKSFLRLEATQNTLTITCYGVTGCAEHEEDPPVEDRVEIRLDRQSPEHEWAPDLEFVLPKGR
jgi:hypothetical protein